MRNKKGYLLPMAVIYIIIAVILGAGILYLGGLEKIGGMKRLHREKAFYLAEAGAYRTYAYLKDDINAQPAMTGELGDGTFSLSVVPEPDRWDADSILITSTGKVHNVEETVRLALSSVGIFADGIFGRDSVSLQGGVEISGYDSRNGNASTDYDVGSNGDVIVSGSSTISGNEKTNQERILPDVDIPFDVPHTLQGAQGLSGSYQINAAHNFSVTGQAGISTGDYRFNDFTLSSSNSILTVTGKVRVLVEGMFFMSANHAAVTLSENSTLEIYLGAPDGTMSVTGGCINEGGSPAAVAIYSASESGISFGGNVDIYAVLYAPQVNVIASQGTPEFRGCIVSDKITTVGNVAIYYDVALKSEDAGPKFFKISRWTKPFWVRFQ